MLEKNNFIEHYKYDLEVKYKDYLKYEMTIKPKLSQVLSLTLRDRLKFNRNQLHHVMQRLNQQITPNYNKEINHYKKIKARSVIERQLKHEGLVHSHSILAIHKDIEDKFLKNFEIVDGKLFVRSDLMERRFYKLAEIECQKLLTSKDVDRYLRYMFKKYKADADDDGKLGDEFCFPASAIPSDINRS